MPSKALSVFLHSWPKSGPLSQLTQPHLKDLLLSPLHCERCCEAQTCCLPPPKTSPLSHRWPTLEGLNTSLRTLIRLPPQGRNAPPLHMGWTSSLTCLNRRLQKPGS